MWMRFPTLGVPSAVMAKRRVPAEVRTSENLRNLDEEGVDAAFFLVEAAFFVPIAVNGSVLGSGQPREGLAGRSRPGPVEVEPAVPNGNDTVWLRNDAVW